MILQDPVRVARLAMSKSVGCNAIMQDLTPSRRIHARQETGAEVVTQPGTCAQHCLGSRHGLQNNEGVRTIVVAQQCYNYRPDPLCYLLSVQGNRITPEHWDAVGAPHDTPVMGTEGGKEFTRVMLGDTIDMDYEQAEIDILEAGETLLKKNPDVGAIVCENHNMAPYAAALNARLGVPIFTVYTFVCWFQAGLQPRYFGRPGVPSEGVWRERY